MKTRFSLILGLIFSLIAAPIFAQPPPSAAPAAPAAGGQPDFSDTASWKLTTHAWQAMEANDLNLVKAYTQKCISMYEKQAVEMQAELKEPVDTSNKEKTFANWAVNDVGTCYFILGQALEKAGDKKGALEAYKNCAKFPSSECWDPKGWFWKPADAAKGKIKALGFDAAS